MNLSTHWAKHRRELLQQVFAALARLTNAGGGRFVLISQNCRLSLAEDRTRTHCPGSTSTCPPLVHDVTPPLAFQAL